MSRAAPELHIPVSYRLAWQDGFGARGWKLDCSIGDPAVIAATAETGARIPTSVFVHDILDHHLCGLAMSGHRNEAIALMQLASRTGADPRPDFTQMVDEDLMAGQVNGESLHRFLPADLLARLPAGIGEGRPVSASLVEQLGREPLRQRLIDHFFTLGRQGTARARQAYRASGLDDARRGKLGMALQQLLQEMDALALQESWPAAQGEIALTNEACAFLLRSPARHELRLRY